MAWSGVGELVDIPGRLTAADYVDILEDVLLPTVRALFADEDELHVYLCQDNSPIHTARVVRDWFVRHPEVTFLDWPPRSPDLNPIEHVWAHMSKRWNGYDGRNQRELFDGVKVIWENLRAQPNVPQELVESMPRRLRKVIEAEGGYTKY